MTGFGSSRQGSNSGGEHLSNPPLTTGQVDLLRADNVTTRNAPGLRELGIEPKAIEDIVPTYLLRSRAGA